jgi:hypothetical protein
MKIYTQQLIDFIQSVKIKALEVHVNAQYTAKKIDLSRVSRFEILNNRLQKLYRLRSQCIEHKDFYKALQAMHLINCVGIELSTTYNYTAL